MGPAADPGSEESEREVRGSTWQSSTAQREIDGEGHAAVSALADPEHDIAFPDRK